jgi:hypothetical protein
MNKKRIFSIIIIGLATVTLVLCFTTVLKVDITISTLVLAATAWVIAKQAFATEEMVRNQIKPSVDVSMIFNKEESGTCFQFINITKVPALVWITIDVNKNGEKIKVENDYLTGKKRIDIDVRSWVTSPGFLKELTNTEELVEVVLRVDVAPMFDEKARYPFQKKSYRFEAKEKEWIRTPFWGIAEKIDPRFLIARGNIKNEDGN